MGEVETPAAATLSLFILFYPFLSCLSFLSYLILSFYLQMGELETAAAATLYPYLTTSCSYSLIFIIRIMLYTDDNEDDDEDRDDDDEEKEGCSPPIGLQVAT